MAFPQDPLAVTIELYYDAAWNDITSYVYHRDAAPITITRGRQNEGQRCDPGKLTLELNNRDGRFSPRNPNSPLFGKIGRNTQIRVKVTFNAVTYTRFVGEITSWPSRWDVSGVDIWVPLEAWGILKRLGQGQKPVRPSLNTLILADGPAQYWRVDDPEGVTQASSSLINGGAPLTIYKAPVFAALVGPPGGSDSNAQLSTGSLFNESLPPIGPPFTVEYSLARPQDGSADGSQIFLIEYLVNGSLATQGIAVAADANVSARDWYHYKFEFTQNGANYDIHEWRNGVDLGVVLSPAGTLGALTGVVAGDDGNTIGDSSLVGVGYIATYSGTGIVDAQQHSDALQGYPGEQAHVRFGRLCAQLAIPYTVTGSYSEQMDIHQGVPLLDTLRDCEATDQGFLGETREALGLRFQTNESRYNQVPIALSYTSGHISPPFDPEPDDFAVANDREVESRAGATARVELATGSLSTQDPPNGVGRYDDTVTVGVYDVDRVPHIAWWRLHVGTWDAERYPQIHVDLAAASNTSLIPQLAAADSGGLITIDNLPAWLPPETAELLIEGYTETISFFGWDFIFNCSPAGPYNVVGVWALLSQILHTAMNTSVATADIATTAGPLLATAASAIGSAGYGITIGGEEMQITAVAASTVTAGAAGTASTGSSGSRTPGLPASSASGDLILIFASTRNSGTGTVDTPANWTRLAIFPSSCNAQVFARIYDGVWSMPTITFTGGAANEDTIAQSIRLAGKWHSASNVLHSAASCLNASAQNITYPGLPKPDADNCIIIYFGWKQDDYTSVATISAATEIEEASSIAGNDASQIWDYVIQTTAAAIASGVFTVTGGAAAISRGAVAALRCDYQTATVTRSTNGVSASHSASDAVTATRPMRWGL